MLIHKDVCAKQVMQMLSLAFSQEKAQWKPWKYSEVCNMEKDAEVSGQQRDAVVKWLSGLNDFLRFTPETVFVAASMLDSFLHSVRAHPKYLYCIAISCFYIAIKITEEDEVIPTIQELLDISHCGCSVAELVRMERVILRKMDWNLKRITALDFLHIFHGLLALNCPGLLGMNQVGAGSFLVWLGVKLKASLPFFKLTTFRPSAVALSLISLELQSSSRNWFAFTIALQKLAEISNYDVIECRGELSKIMFHLYGRTKVYNPCYKKTTYFPLNPVKRKGRHYFADSQFYDLKAYLIIRSECCNDFIHKTRIYFWDNMKNSTVITQCKGIECSLLHGRWSKQMLKTSMTASNVCMEKMEPPIVAQLPFKIPCRLCLIITNLHLLQQFEVH